MNYSKTNTFKILVRLSIIFLISTSSLASDRSKMKKSFTFSKDILGENYFDYDKAKKIRASKKIQFTINETCEVDGDQIKVIGWLINGDPQAVEIIVFPVSGLYPLDAHIMMTTEVKWKIDVSPKMSPVPPPPMIIKIPGQSKIKFEYRIDISNLLYKGTPNVEIKWTFNYWNEPKPTGIIRFVLPAR